MPVSGCDLFTTGLGITHHADGGFVDEKTVTEGLLEPGVTGTEQKLPKSPVGE